MSDENWTPVRTFDGQPMYHGGCLAIQQNGDLRRILNLNGSVYLEYRFSDYFLPRQSTIQVQRGDETKVET